MNFNINAQTFPRYLTICMTGIIMLSMAIIVCYLLTTNYLDKQSRLSELRLDVEQENRDRIKNEIDMALKYIDTMKSKAESVAMEITKEKVDQAHDEITTIYNLTR